MPVRHKRKYPIVCIIKHSGIEIACVEVESGLFHHYYIAATTILIDSIVEVAIIRVCALWDIGLATARLIRAYAILRGDVLARGRATCYHILQGETIMRHT